MNTELVPLLAELDAAPARALTSAEHNRREQLLATVLNDTSPSTRSAARAGRRPYVRRVVFTLTGALAAGVAAAAVTTTPLHDLITGDAGGPLTSAELASWTSTPDQLNASTSRGSTAEKWCLNGIKDADGGAATTIRNADFRGKVASMVVTRGDKTTYCLVGPDGTGMWEVIDPVAKTAADAVTLDSAGSHGAKSTGVSYAEGSMGTDVKAVALHAAGQTVQATVQDGRWTAWWPDPDGGSYGTLTLTLSNGATRTVATDSLFH